MVSPTWSSPTLRNSRSRLPASPARSNCFTPRHSAYLSGRFFADPATSPSLVTWPPAMSTATAGTISFWSPTTGCSSCDRIWDHARSRPPRLRRPGIETRMSTTTAKQIGTALRRDLLEELAWRRFADGHDGGVPELSLNRDGIVPLPDRVDSADQLDVKLPLDLVSDDRRDGEDAEPCLAEDLHQSAVLEFPQYLGADPVGAEPPLKLSIEGAVPCRKQERRTIQRPGKALSVAVGKLWRAQKQDATFSQKVAERLDLHIRRHRGIRDDQVQPVNRQLGHQTIGFILSANDPDRLVSFDRRLQQVKCNHLGHDIGDSDCKPQRPAGRTGLDRIDHLPAEREDLIGVAKHDLAGLRQH